MFMMPRIAADVGGLFDCSVFAPPDPGVRDGRAPPMPPWMPPATRDTSGDAALFAQYADCGPGAVADTEAGQCVAIPGYAEGFAEAKKVTRMLDAKAERHRRFAAENRDKEARLDECMEEGLFESIVQCEKGRLPLVARPQGMSEAECLALWRNGSGGGSDSRDERHDDQTTTSRRHGTTGHLGGELDLGGFRIGASGDETIEGNDSAQTGRSRGKAVMTNRRSFKGYQEQCGQEIAERFPRARGGAR